MLQAITVLAKNGHPTEAAHLLNMLDRGLILANKLSGIYAHTVPHTGAAWRPDTIELNPGTDTLNWGSKPERRQGCEYKVLPAG